MFFFFITLKLWSFFPFPTLTFLQFVRSYCCLAIMLVLPFLFFPSLTDIQLPLIVGVLFSKDLDSPYLTAHTLTQRVSVCVGLLSKFGTLRCFFSIQKVKTSSRDFLFHLFASLTNKPVLAVCFLQIRVCLCCQLDMRLNWWLPLKLSVKQVCWVLPMKRSYMAFKWMSLLLYFFERNV